MIKHSYLFGWLILLQLLTYSSYGQAQSSSPVRITYPESRAIFQRDNDNTSTIFVSGSYYQPVDEIQARLVAEVAGQGISTNWETVQRNPTGGVFQGSVKATGGWYKLEVRVLSRGEVVGEDVVRKIGIGEVFIITGQSNAQGFQDFGAAGATDDRVNCVTYNNYEANSLNNPPAPTFAQLGPNTLIGPRGQSAWCWGLLGDMLVRQYNVPVLFINTAWAGTTIRNWVESSNGRITKNIFAMGTPFENFPAGMPYANLVIALRYYCSLQGLRAVLWQQGETDNVPLRLGREEYRNAMQFMVNKTRADTRRYPAWILARSSYNNGETSENVVQAQTDVINTYNNNVYPGPFTDNLQIPRPDGVHFSGEGLTELAKAWYESMNAVFFASSIPLLPLPSPTATISCTGANNAITVTLPDFFKQYEWQSGQKTRSITITQPGTYRATLKDENGNTYLSPAIEVTGPIRPTAPVIALADKPTEAAASQQQVCADSVLTLTAMSATPVDLVWNNSLGVATRNISIGQAGTYTAQAVNVYGCRSQPSSPINLVVRPKLNVPTVQQVGTYSLRANLPTYNNNEQFDWRRGNAFLNQNGTIAKVTANGTYTARTKAVFTLNNSNSLTCYSTFSEPVEFVVDDNNRGLSIYPNPTQNGLIMVETLENLPNALIRVVTLSGQTVFSATVPAMNERKVINLGGMAEGQYILQVKAEGFDVSKRFVIDY